MIPQANIPLIERQAADDCYDHAATNTIPAILCLLRLVPNLLVFYPFSNSAAEYECSSLLTFLLRSICAGAL